MEKYKSLMKKVILVYRSLSCVLLLVQAQTRQQMGGVYYLMRLSFY